GAGEVGSWLVGLVVSRGTTGAGVGEAVGGGGWMHAPTPRRTGRRKGQARMIPRLGDGPLCVKSVKCTNSTPETARQKQRALSARLFRPALRVSKDGLHGGVGCSYIRAP